MLTVGSLFSGIGGIELGLERTGGFRTIWQSEIDAYASAVLAEHWPGVPNLGDITKVDWAQVERPDLICGGFPCQDISIAGKGAGIKEETRSGLWKKFYHAIRTLRPRYALVENVSALSFRGLCIVLGDLAEAGYDAEWFTLRASDVGAPHKRERLFIVAYPDSIGCGGGCSVGQRKAKISTEIERRGSNSDSSRFQKQHQCFGSEATYSSSFKSIRGNVESRLGRIIDGLPERLDAPWKGNWEEGTPRVTQEKENRVNRLKCLGNAVVPQVAQVIGQAILE